MKKRSPLSSNSSSTSSSSSSSCIDSINDTTQQQQQQTKAVRPQKCKKQDNSQTNAAKRSSIYRGVTRHRWTGRYEAHLWDKSTWNRVHNKRGRQIYLGAYDSEEAAARTYDLAALKFWGPGTILNFPIETYTKELEDMQKLSKEEYLASLRRHSSGFSRGVSKYRGVARHHHNGRWEARIGRVRGNKYLYLGTYSTQEEAAAAYDRAAIEYRGPNAVTNFDIGNYVDKLKKPKPSTQIKQETLAECSEEPQHELIIKQERQEEEQESTQEASHELCNHHQDQQEGNLVVQTEVTEVPDLEFELEEESTEEASHELYDHHQDQQEEDVVVQTRVTEVPDLEFEPSVEPHRMVVMDLEDEHEHEYPWDLCLDIGFSSLPVSDIPLDEKPTELPDINFYDDIDLMFDAAAYENDQDAMSGNAGCEIVIKEEKGQESSTSSLSPLSTTTSVSGEV